MRRYKYRCPTCKHEISEIVQNSDEIVLCPKCGKKMTQLFSMPNIATDTIVPGGFFSEQLQMRVDSKSEIKKELHRRGWGSETFNIPVQQSEPKPYRVAQDIVDRETDIEVVEKHGGTVSKKKYREIQEEKTAVLSGN